MVAHFLVRYFLPNQRLKNGRLKKHQLYARDLMTSAVEDVDIVLDWWYWYDTWVRNVGLLPKSLLRAQLVFTVLGTFVWAMVASDGHLMHCLCRVLFTALCPILTFLGTITETLQRHCRVIAVFDSKKAIKRTNQLLDQQTSAGFMLLLGIIFEDIPQTIITFLLEHLDDVGGLQFTGLAAANFLSSLYNALIKLADAYDLRHDVLVPSGPLKTWQGHDSAVTCFASINGNKFLSASQDNATIKLWKLSRSGECRQEYEGHYHSISSMAMLGNDLFVSGSFDYTIKLWNWSTGKCLYTFTGHTLDILAVAAVDHDRFLSASYDMTIKLWSKSSRACLGTFTGHTEISCLAVVGNDCFVSSSGFNVRDGSIKLWSLTSAEDNNGCIRTFERHTDSVTCIASMNKESFLSGSADKTVKLWHLASGVCLRTFRGHSDAITALAVAKEDTSCFLSGSADKTIQLHNALTGECIHVFYGHTSGVTEVAIMGNGRFVSGSKDGNIIVWYMGVHHESTLNGNSSNGQAAEKTSNSGYVIAPG